MALLCAGHAVSSRQSNSRVPIRAIIVGVGVIGSLALSPRVASQAAGCDWLPAAHFLLLYQAIISFELRSRSGLYASIGLSGATLFFASQHAVDSFFGIFLRGFATLVLAFFTVSFLVDQLRDVEVRWFGSRFTFGWFWCVILSVALAVSLGVFLLLPNGLSGTDCAAHASALPVGASAPTDELEALARNGPVDVQGPLNEPDQPASDDTRKDADASGADVPDSAPPTGPSATDGPTTVPQTEAMVPEGQPSHGPAAAASPIAGAGETSEAPAVDRVVMNVRSPVLTYWRDRVFDTFDGARWVPGPELWARSPCNSNEAVYFSDSAGEGDARPRYVQDILPEG